MFSDPWWRGKVWQSDMPSWRQLTQVELERYRLRLVNIEISATLCLDLKSFLGSAMRLPCREFEKVGQPPNPIDRSKPSLSSTRQKSVQLILGRACLQWNADSKIRLKDSPVLVFLFAGKMEDLHEVDENGALLGHMHQATSSEGNKGLERQD